VKLGGVAPTPGLPDEVTTAKVRIDS
jgi:hypothetical protein